MKENNKYIVFYSAEKNCFLTSYKDKGNIAFTATFDPRLWEALQLPFEPYEKQKTELDKLAEVMGCEVLIVEAEYNLTKLDGSDFERTEREESMEDRIGALLNLLTN